MNPTDIEIYLKDTTLANVTNWLISCLGECSEWQQKGKVLKCFASTNNIPITWYEKAVGNWYCLHIDSNKTPWADDLACALSASNYLKIEIRCAPNEWSEQENESNEQANQWLKVVDQLVSNIVWHT